MLGVDLFTIVLNSLVFFVYGSICIISIIFTFFIQTYHKLDEMMELKVISGKPLTPLETNINLIDTWLIERHRIVGPILIALSLVDLKLSFKIISLL